MAQYVLTVRAPAQGTAEASRPAVSAGDAAQEASEAVCLDVFARF